MEKATIYDYARMCRANECEDCPFRMRGKRENEGCADFIIEHSDKANEIILNWCKEHPVETRLDKLMKVFPNLITDGMKEEKVAMICPKEFDKRFSDEYLCSDYFDNCTECRKEYWFAEVEENE